MQEFLSPLSLAVLTIFPGCMLIAAFTDLATMTIPNKLSIALVAGFSLLVILTGMPLQEAAIHFAIGFGVLVLGFILFALNLLGGGDAKFVAATSLWMGLSGLLPFFVTFAMIGGLFGIMILSFRQLPLPSFCVRYQWIARLHEPKGDIPYGVALSIGGLIVFPETPIFAMSVA